MDWMSHQLPDHRDRTGAHRGTGIASQPGRIASLDKLFRQVIRQLVDFRQAEMRSLLRHGRYGNPEFHRRRFGQVP
jgi:hypothetical protein